MRAFLAALSITCKRDREKETQTLNGGGLHHWMTTSHQYFSTRTCQRDAGKCNQFNS